MTAVLRGRLLGRFELSVDGRTIERSAFERPSGMRLLKLLLATPGHRVRREAAAELLWPETDPERSGANLRKAIHFARRAMDSNASEGDSLIRGGADSLRIADDAGLELDLDRLRAALDDTRTADRTADRPAELAAAPTAALAAEPVAAPDWTALETIADLGGAELLPEDPYEEWLVPIRERLRQQTLAALQRGAAVASAAGHTDLAFRLVDGAIALEPADEAAHRIAIELHLAAGQLHAARRQLLACARALAETYNVEPSPELGALIEAAAKGRSVAAPLLAGEAPIIGRRRELEGADAALDAVVAGRLGVVIYRGAAGIGKTRVLRELARSAASSGWRIVEARGLESSPDLAFAALGTGLATALAGDLPMDLAEPGRSAILAISPSFADRPAVTFATDAALLAALVEALSALSRERPTVLAMDDIQWLDRPTIELLDRALVALADSPILLVGTVRDAPDPLPRAVVALLDDVERAGGRVSRLGPVAPRELEQLLERELAGGRLEPGLVAAIVERSGGAPLFALELLRAARDDGTIVERTGAWRLATTEATLPVPPGVGLMVERRLEALPPGVIRILTLAAEVGDQVPLERLVAAVEGGDRTSHAAEVLDALDAGLAAGLLVERAGAYAFAHPLFRSALRGSVRPRARADLHLRVAQALARGVDPAAPGAIGAAAAIGRDVVGIAAHALDAVELGRAEALPLAVGFGFVAGERQAALFDHGAAIATLQRALAHWTRLPVDTGATYPASGASLQLGWSRHALRDEPGASLAFRAAVGQARDDPERARAWQALAWMPYQHGRFDDADAILGEALPSISDSIARASIEADRAWIMGRRGDWAGAYRVLTTVVAVMEGAASPALLSRSLDRLGVAMRDALDPDGAVPVFERALRLAHESGDPRLAATVQMHLAGAYRQIGRLDDARREIDAALVSCSMTGDRYIEAVTVWIAAEVEHAGGRYPEAITLRRRELEMLGALGGNEHNQAMAHAHIAFLARLLGDAALESDESRVARLIAQHSGLSHLPGRIEQALASEAWFIEDPPRRKP
ncbi:MAG: AAA family ATPase [Candidatus Limnocylindrales bacterium]